MIILRAAQTELGFLLWGESSPASSVCSAPSPAAAAMVETAPALSPEHAAKTKTENSAPSPFDARQAALDAILTEHLDLSPGDAYPLEGIAWLPSSKFGPMTSSRLLHDVEKAKTSLRPTPMARFSHTA